MILWRATARIRKDEITEGFCKAKWQERTTDRDNLTNCTHHHVNNGLRRVASRNGNPRQFWRFRGSEENGNPLSAPF
jgi:hypothetical protein